MFRNSSLIRRHKKEKVDLAPYEATKDTKDRCGFAVGFTKDYEK